MKKAIQEEKFHGVIQGIVQSLYVLNIGSTALEKVRVISLESDLDLQEITFPTAASEDNTASRRLVPSIV